MKLSSPLTPLDTSCWTLGYSNKWQAGNTLVLKAPTAWSNGRWGRTQREAEELFQNKLWWLYRGHIKKGHAGGTAYAKALRQETLRGTWKGTAPQGQRTPGPQSWRNGPRNVKRYKCPMTGSVQQTAVFYSLAISYTCPKWCLKNTSYERNR